MMEKEKNLPPPYVVSHLSHPSELIRTSGELDTDTFFNGGSIRRDMNDSDWHIKSLLV